MQLKSQMSNLKKTLKSLRKTERKSGGQATLQSSISASVSDDCIEEENAVSAVSAEIDATTAQLEILLETLRIRVERLAECRGEQAMSFSTTIEAVDLIGELSLYVQESIQ